ncbi:MAG: CoA transferase [Dehalococcoidia bacterium]
MLGALSGIRVIDFTEYIAGPYGTMMLADMGADVIKIERPHGDAWRHTAPIAPYEGRGYLGVNRGKRSVALDLDKPEAREIAHKLIADADVVVTNYRPGVAKRLGLDYETLSRDNERLVYCENSAFGPSGPYQGRAGYDILSQAATGMILYENKLIRGVPQQIHALAVADLTTGMFMAYAIVNALFARTQSGRGQRIETSLFASGLAAQYRPLLSVDELDAPVREGFLQELTKLRESDAGHEEATKLRSQYIPGRAGNSYYRVYETKDGLIAVACLNNPQRRRLRDAIGIDDATVEGMSYDWFSEEVRKTHKRIAEEFEGGFREKRTEEWIDALDAADVPCAPVNFPEEMYANPHVEANGLMLALEHDVLGTVRLPACPIDMSESDTGSERPPPSLGADGPDVLRSLGYDDDAIAQLLDAGVLYTRERLLGEGS